MAFSDALALTHAGNDAVDREPRGSMVEGPRGLASFLLVLVLKCRILFFGYINVKTDICSIHNVSRTWIQ